LIVGAVFAVADGELSFFLHPAAWGNGIATEAVQWWTRAYFQNFRGKEYVTANVLVENEVARKLLRRIGAKEGDAVDGIVGHWGPRGMKWVSYTISRELADTWKLAK
jgi:RimJ/RimL family protein N-acetyltransferase